VGDSMKDVTSWLIMLALVLTVVLIVAWSTVKG
jgi:hypothetical protein